MKPLKQWQSSKVEEIATTATGGTPARDVRAYFEGRIPWVKSGELNDNLIYETEEHLSEEGIKKSSAKIFPAGTVLIALYGATVGKTAILKITAATNQAVCAVFVDKYKIDASYLRYFFMHVRPDLLSQRYGGAQPNISQTIIRNTVINYPALDEQRRCAAVLSAVQRAIERQERLMTLTAELKRALMHKLFTEGTRGEPLKQTEIGPVPHSWTIKSVGEVSNLVSGGTPSKANTAFWIGSIPWASPKDMKKPRLYDAQDHISKVGLEDGSRLVPAGSIFVVIRGMILMREVPIAQAAVPMAFNQDMKALVSHRGVTPDFLLYTLQRARDRLLQKVGVSAHGTRTLMTSAIEQLRIAIPAEQEQALIAESMRLLESKEEMHRRTRDSLQGLFRTLLHQLMTAKIRVQDLDLSALETQTQDLELAGA